VWERRSTHIISYILFHTYTYNSSYSLFRTTTTTTTTTNLGKLQLIGVMQLGGNNKRLLYAYRLHKDIAELFSHNFDCSSSSLLVIQQHPVSNQYHSRNGNGIISQVLSDTGNINNSSESLAFNDRGYITLQIKIFEGHRLPMHVVIIDLI